MVIAMKNFMAVAGIPLPALSHQYETVVLDPDTLLAPPVSHHADMILTIFDGKLFCHRAYYENNRETVERIADFGSLNIIVSDCPRGEKYPLDVAFNALPMGNRLLCRRGSICPELREYDIVNTNQGYAGCTSLYAAGTVVTADEATARACQKENIPVYRISGRDILLSEYNTGFIGGACGVCGDTVYIFGDPRLSQSGRELEVFCSAKGLNLVSLQKGSVTDIGGIKFIGSQE